MNDNITLNTTDLLTHCVISNSSPLLPVCQLLAYTILFIMSIFGNSILIGAIVNYPRTQTIMNYYIINMAVADLLTTVFDMAVQIWHYGLLIANKPFEWFSGVFGEFMCKFVVFIQGTAQACTVLTLTAIAINRFLAVMFPLRRAASKTKVVIILLLIWGSSLAIASPMLYTMRLHEGQGAFSCIENWEPFFDNASSPRHYTLALFSLLYVAPLLMIAILYSVIAFKLWVRTVPGNVTAPNQLLELETRRKILKICMTVVFIFTLCWLPYYIYLMIQFVPENNGKCYPPEYVAFLGLFFGDANSSINPFIYIIFNSEYQKGMKKVLKRCCIPCKSNKLRMYSSRITLISYPSLRTFRELELTPMRQTLHQTNSGFKQGFIISWFKFTWESQLINVWKCAITILTNWVLTCWPGDHSLPPPPPSHPTPEKGHLITGYIRSNC